MKMKRIPASLILIPSGLIFGSLAAIKGQSSKVITNEKK